MRIEETLMLIPGQDGEDSCALCCEPTLGVMECCHFPLCPECLNRWSQESNTCPHCRAIIHDGEDRRHENIDNPPPEPDQLPASIAQFVQACVSSAMTQYVVENRILFPNTISSAIKIELDVELSYEDIATIAGSLGVMSLCFVYTTYIGALFGLA